MSHVERRKGGGRESIVLRTVEKGREGKKEGRRGKLRYILL